MGSKMKAGAAGGEAIFTRPYSSLAVLHPNQTGGVRVTSPRRGAKAEAASEEEDEECSICLDRFGSR